MANKALNKGELYRQMQNPKYFTMTRSGKDQQETRQAIFFLEQYDIKCIELFTSSVTKRVLVVGNNYIYQADIFTSAPY